MSTRARETDPGTWPPPDAAGPLAVLTSGGIDSGVLAAEALRGYERVHPIYVRVGSAWEADELDHLRRFLAALRSSRLQPLTVLDQPVADLYGAHWSLTGEDVPDEHTPDEAVFLPGRNVLLLAKPLLWCHLNGVPALAVAPLAANPFPDATPSFFAAFEKVVNEAVGGSVRVLRPYAGLTKAAVVLRGRDLPLAEAFSCIRPVAGRHCGRCNKCAERRRAFAAAAVPDPTRYAD
jgi:7-cyano-7-deazaguanine synthase